MDRDEIKRLARARVRDAEVLYRNKRYHGAIYLCGYAVEMALKARICQTLRWTEYPDTGQGLQSFRTHNLVVLRELCGIGERIAKQATAEWTVAIQWSEQAPYQPLGAATETNARALIDAAKVLLKILFG